MGSQHRARYVVVGLLVGAVLLPACGAPADETGAGRPTPSSAQGRGGPGSLGKILPAPEGSARLDPETKKVCEALWAVNTVAYAARAAEPTAEERERYRKGLDEYEPQAAAVAPTLRAEIKLLAAHARAALTAGGTAAMTPELTAANQRVVDYLRNVCKFKMS
jgi:hypothetical protein